MPIDPAVIAFVEAAAVANEGRPATHEGTVEQARAGYDALAKLAAGPELPIVSDEEIPSPNGMIPVRVYRPSTAEGLGALIFFHGGGWVIGGLVSHDRECRTLCERSGCVVIAVDYRLAPEHPYPAAVDDCWSALSHVHANADAYGVDPSRLAVGGDSAGGNLAAVVAQRARETDIELCLQILVCPVVDVHHDGSPWRTDQAPPLLPRETMQWFSDRYFAGVDPVRRGEVDASPLLADSLAGVAPALIATAEFDVLRDEGNAYAAGLSDAGVDVTVKQWAGMPHAFMQLSPVVPTGDILLTEIAESLRQALSA